MNDRLEVDAAERELSGSTLFESQAEAAASTAAPLERGSTLSRYLLVDRIGAGGMGVVWAAYDPELDRKVAIKLLRPRKTGPGDDKARTRLIREAQAMARLSHPNVIAVHDVGEHGGQVFVAMEFVDGPTLGRWVRDGHRAWREVVAMFVQAGRGLAEAHRAGLVHRDFKPDNVLIGDGRARVTDFGLARSVESVTLDGDDDPSGSGEVEPASPREPISALDTPLTRTGIMIGTPAYMAPEQFDAGNFDARSDQFSFCVALWEALYGRRPFAGQTLAALGESVKAGRITAPPSEARVPSFIEQALRRGLAVDPGARWPAIDDLLRELQRDPALGRRRWLVGGGLVACFAAALALAPILAEPEPAAAPVCPDASAHLDGIWDDGRREQLQTTILRSGADDPETAWARLSANVDAYVDSWLAMHRDACEATHVRHEQSQELLDLRMQCLETRHVDLAAKLDLLAAGDAEILGSATELLAGLPPIEACGRRAYLEASVPIPADEALAERVAAIRGRLAEAKARVDIGEAEAMLPVLRELRTEAMTVGYAPLEAEVLSELAFASGGTGTPSETRELLEEAVIESIRTGLDAQAARAAIELAYVVGTRLGYTEEGLRWARRVDAWHDRLDATDLSRARIAIARASIYRVDGQLDAANEQTTKSLELVGLDPDLGNLDDLDPSELLVTSWALSNRALIAYGRGDPHTARKHLGAALPIYARLHGVRSVDTLKMELNYAVLGLMTGDWAEARASLERLRPDMEARRELSPGLHALTLVNLASHGLERSELGLQDIDAPLRELVEQGWTEMIAAFTEYDPRIAEAWAIAARLDRLEGRHELAANKLTRALEIIAIDEQAGKVLPQEAMLPKLERAALAFAIGDLDDAGDRYAGLVTEAEASASASGGQLPLAKALTGLGRTQLALGRDAEARTSLARALELWDALAPAGHPESIPTLELLAQLDEPRAAQLRERAAAIRDRAG